MSQCIKTRFDGLDVHKDTILVAVAEPGREAARVVTTVPHERTEAIRDLERARDDAKKAERVWYGIS